MAIHVTPERVRATADLARLDLREDEVAPFAAQLQKILDHMGELDALSGLAEAADEAPGAPLRDDVPRAGVARDVVLAQAPRHEGGAFSVARFVED